MPRVCAVNEDKLGVYATDILYCLEKRGDIKSVSWFPTCLPCMSCRPTTVHYGNGDRGALHMRFRNMHYWADMLPPLPFDTRMYL